MKINIKSSNKKNTRQASDVLLYAEPTANQNHRKLDSVEHKKASCLSTEALPMLPWKSTFGYINQYYYRAGLIMV